MAARSSIEWTDATWNPITGCTAISAGCRNCYAARLASGRLQHHPSRAGLTRTTKGSPVWTGEIRRNLQWMYQPLRWRSPRSIFVAAHSDLFHTNVPEDWIVEIFAIMARTPRHTYQILTKRPRRMQSLLARVEFWSAVEDRVRKRLSDIPPFRAAAARVRDCLPNVWVGASIERQEVERERTDALLSTPAAVRFLSLEPLLGDLDISAALPRGCSAPECPCETDTDCADRGVDWVIAGGESGPGARPMDPQWVRNIRDQCILAAVPFFFKQWGSWGPTVVRGETRMRRMSKLRAGRVLDGRTWDEMPAWTR